jgi:chemotaxis protein MotB
MALARRSGQRFQANIWPGFVDAMTALLLVLMFVLTIFMIVQFMLQETITGQETELHELEGQIASLAEALGAERSRAADLESDLGEIAATLANAREESAARAALIASLTADLDTSRAETEAAEVRAANAEAEALRIAGERDTAAQERDAALGEAEALTAALAAARTEIDEGIEAARLAAAQREALELLIADLRARADTAGAEAERLTEELTEAEAARLVEAESARLLAERLDASQAELSTMTLALDNERKLAEEMLTLLAAAEAARDDLAGQVAALTEAEKRAALLAVANAELAEAAEAEGAESARQAALLNEQLAALRTQLGDLQSILDEAQERDRAAQVQIEALGGELNTALAQVAAEQRRRAELEEAERRRLEEEALELESYRSDFFGKLREVLDGREGVRIVGDRFVFSSEVLFETGSAELAPEGRSQIASVAELLLGVAADIPPEIDWILRVDGHTDDLPITGGRFADNWELSQARALSVVRYMTEELGFPPERLAATGFGEFRPVARGGTEEARAQNRRIELKLTER